MTKTKLLTGVLLVLAVLFAQVGTVFAAPAAQDTNTITGTVTNIDTTDGTAVLVTVEVNGQTQTFSLAPSYAEQLGLVTITTDANGAPVVTAVDFSTTPLDVTIDTTQATPVADQPVEVHPIAAILADFFGMDPVAVNTLHQDGFGFGVIAQALWLQKSLDDDSVTAKMILEAKQNNDYSTITLPDGTNPTNWGQFRKALLDKKNNLGIIVSGHAENGTEESTLSQQSHGKGNGKDNNPGKGKGKNKNP